MASLFKNWRMAYFLKHLYSKPQTKCKCYYWLKNYVNYVYWKWYLKQSTSFLDINAEQFQFCFLWQILLNEPNLKTEKNNKWNEQNSYHGYWIPRQQYGSNKLQLKNLIKLNSHFLVLSYLQLRSHWWESWRNWANYC